MFGKFALDKILFDFGLLEIYGLIYPWQPKSPGIYPKSDADHKKNLPMQVFVALMYVVS
jgi:hypothetical protein